MTNKNKWWYPDDFWIEAIKILVIGFVIQVGLLFLIGIPNLIFKWSWLQYISWLIPLNFLICQIFIFIIVVKGLWRKIKNE